MSKITEAAINEDNGLVPLDDNFVVKTTENSGEKRPVGRPKTIIDYDKVKELARVMATQEEIAAVIGVNVSTLRRDKEFCNVFKDGIKQAKASLRRKQFALADKNASMAMFLGKNYLGQRDDVSGGTMVNFQINLSKELKDLAE